MKTIKKEIREMIESTLEVDELGITDDENFSNTDLDLDSIAVLELELKLKKKYNIKMENLPRETFVSIEKIAEFVAEHKR